MSKHIISKSIGKDYWVMEAWICRCFYRDNRNSESEGLRRDAAVMFGRYLCCLSVLRLEYFIKW